MTSDFFCCKQEKSKIQVNIGNYSSPKMNHFAEFPTKLTKSQYDLSREFSKYFSAIFM